MHGIPAGMKVWSLPFNPLTVVDRPRIHVSDDLHGFSPEAELLALQWGDHPSPA